MVMISVQFVPILGTGLAAGVLLASGWWQARPKKDPAVLSARWQTVALALCSSFVVLWGLTLYITTAYSYSDTQAAISELMRNFGLTALALVFLARLPTIIHRFFPSGLADQLFGTVRRRLAVSALSFGLLHGTIGFFHNLAGHLNVFGYLSLKHRIAVVCGVFLLLLMVLFWCVGQLAAVWQRWQKTTRLITKLAGLIILLGSVHGLLIGSDLTSVRSVLSVLIAAGCLAVVLLELIALLHWLQARNMPRIVITCSTFAVATLLFAAPVILRNYLVTIARQEVQRELEGRGYRH